MCDHGKDRHWEVCTDKFFCVSRVADRQERAERARVEQARVEQARVEQARAEQERVEREGQEGERLVRERGEEREMGAARVDRDRAADMIVREADRITRIPESLVREVEVDSFVTLATGLLRQREVIRLKREREGDWSWERKAEREREGDRVIREAG